MIKSTKLLKEKWPFILTGLWITLITSIGVWWLYLIVYLGRQLNELSHASGANNVSTLKAINVVEMAKWEGSTFFLLLGLVSFFLISFYVKDLKKTQSMQVFFAAISHELKTPSASMRLQAEVIQDQLDHFLPQPPAALKDLINRLVEDSQRLEHELEQILQLSRVERDAGLSLRCFDFEKLVKQIIKKEFRSLQGKMQYTFEENLLSSGLVLVDDYALTMILRNLLDNTMKYSSEKMIHLSFTQQSKNITLNYQDSHQAFSGDSKKLSQLFYTTGKGSGIGLYLIKKLMSQMNGTFTIQSHPYLSFHLTLPLTKELRSE